MPSFHLSKMSLNEVGFRGCTVEEYCSAEHTGEARDRPAVDRFSITVPYSNTSFKMKMLLSADSTQLAPDFIFDDETFLSDCDAAELSAHLPALRDWGGLSDLPALLRQLVTAYKAHVTGRLTPGGLLLDGYSRLLEELGPDRLEPMVVDGEPRPALLLAVRLPLDFTTLWRPPPGRPPPCALLIIRATEKGGLQARLRLSPSLAELVPDCRLPPPAGRPLPEYVQLVTTLTQRQLQEACDGRQARRLLLAALSAAVPDRLLDFSPDCGRLALRWEGAVAELLLAAYPRRPPTLCLASTAGHWRREVPVTVTDAADVTQVVTTIMDKVEELLKGVDQGDDSDDSLI